LQRKKQVLSKIKNMLQSAWYMPTLLSFLILPLLWLLSLVYTLLAFTHRQLYKIGILKTHKISVPVIVVGNIVTGGGGKTPTVIALVQHLQAQNIQVGVISRGYGRTSTECLEVKKNSAISDVGDEPAGVFAATSAPVFVAKQRVEAANKLLKTYPNTQVIISDDGLQHHALHRDIAITVFDDRGIGNGFMLPAGPLRESKIAAGNSLVLHTGNALAKLPPKLSLRLTDSTAPQFTARRALASYAQRSDGSQVSLNVLTSASKPILALAGIANPEAFFSMLREAGLNLVETISLPDHYDFNSKLYNKYAGYSDKYTVLCTMKDAVKLWKLDPEALAVPLDFAPETAFFEAFDAMLQPMIKR
jgi:tetraacyldisaccharide 4'-kinase